MAIRPNAKQLLWKLQIVVAAVVVALVVIGATQAQRLVGTNGADVLRGTVRSDRINGRGGNDRIFGLGSGDVLIGGAGRDRIWAGPGDDDVNAIDGRADTISCGGGPDFVRADPIDKVAADCELVNPQRLTVFVKGNGLVRSTPKKIGCPSDCSRLVSLHTVVRLTAEAVVGTRFAGWDGACTGTGTTCTLRVESPLQVTATFEPVP